MSKRIRSLLLPGVAILGLAACQSTVQTSDAYWQRIETHSALYLTGPKAQQQLEQDISGCVREVDELIRLQALRETTPPETHQPYQDALRKSGDLAAFETPRHHKNLMVDHSDYYDFESCMRSEGWERVKAVRYQTDAKAKQTYEDTQNIRQYGVTGAAAEYRRKEIQNENQDAYSNLNQ